MLNDFEFDFKLKNPHENFTLQIPTNMFFKVE